MTTLFEKIGGHQAIEALVYEIHKALLQNQEIKHFYDTVDMKRLAAHQRFYFAYLLGGVPEYTGTSLRTSHAHLVKQGLNDTHFDIILDITREAFSTLRIDLEITDQILIRLEALRAEVLNR